MRQTVLIIDDDRPFTAPLRGVLEARGHRVVVHEDASLDLVKAIRPSVILVNAELPRSSGFSVCSRVRHDRDLRATPIMLTSESTSKEALTKHSERPERANLYAAKPLSPVQVVGMLERLMGVAAPSQSRSASDEVTSSEGSPLGAELRRPIANGKHRSSPVRPADAEADRWPRGRFDTELDAVLGPESGEVHPSRSMPSEVRMEPLRAVPTRPQHREQGVQSLFQEMNERGQELGRRLAGLEQQLEAATARLNQVETEKAEVAARLAETEKSFRSFHDEVTRIFTDKDAEEQATLDRLQEAQAQSQELDRALAKAREQHRDDARRLSILQDELDTVHEALDEKSAETDRLTRELTEAKQALSQSAQRLATAEAAEADRAKAYRELRDRSEQQAVQTQQFRARLAAEQEQRLEAESKRAAAALEEERARFSTALDEEKAQTRSTREELDHARGELGRVKHGFAQLQEEVFALREDLSRAKGQIRELESERDRLQGEVSAGAGATRDLESKTSDLERHLQQAQGELAAAQNNLRESEAASSQARVDLASQTERNRTLDERVEALTASLRTTEIRLEEVKKRHQEAQLASEAAQTLRAAAQAKVSELEQNLSAAEAARRQAEETAERGEARHAANDAARLRGERADARIRVLEERLAEAENRGASAELRVEELLKELADVDEENETYGETILELHTRLDDLRSELATLKNGRNGVEEASGHGLQAALRKAEKERARVEKNCEEMSKELERVKSGEGELARQLTLRVTAAESMREVLAGLVNAIERQDPRAADRGPTRKAMLKAQSILQSGDDQDGLGDVVTLEELESGAVDVASMEMAGPLAALAGELGKAEPPPPIMNRHAIPTPDDMDDSDLSEHEVTDVIDVKKLRD